MKKTLSIYACSGIGANPNAENEQYDYWLDNTNTLSNTQAVNSLLCRINTDAIELLKLELTDEEVLERLNEIDWYAATLYFVQQYQDRTSELLQARRAIGKAWDNGLFEYVEFDNRKRDLHLDEVIEKIAQYMDDSSLPEPSSVFAGWWEAEISAKNKVGLTPEQQAKAQAVLNNSKISGIGATEPRKDLQTYLNNAGEYFLYTYATDEQINQLPKEFRTKRAIQRKTYNYCKSLYVDVLGSETQYQETIYASVVKQLGTTPKEAIEATIKTYKNGQAVSGIGIVDPISQATIWVWVLLIMKIVKIIAAILATIVGVVTTIIEVVKAVQVAQFQAVTSADIDASVPMAEDYDDFNLDAQRRKMNSRKRNILIVGAIALFALLRRK